MLSSISGLIAPAALSSPRSRVATETGTQLPVARTPLSATDGFSVAVGAKGAVDIGAMTGASRNAVAGASLLQIADAGLSEISDALTRMKALATAAITTSYSRRDRAIANAEFDQLRTEIDSIVDRVKYKDTKILEGSSLTFKVGTGNASQDSITVAISAATVAGLNAGLAGDTIDDITNATQALTDVTSAIDALGGIQASTDGATARFQAVQGLLTADKHTLTALRTDLLERPVTIGTADHLANMVSQEFLSRAAPAAAGRLSSGVRVLLSTTQLRPIQPLQVNDRTPSQEEVQPQAVKRPAPYETGQNTKSSSRGETSRSVDIKA